MQHLCRHVSRPRRLAPSPSPHPPHRAIRQGTCGDEVCHFGHRPRLRIPTSDVPRYLLPMERATAEPLSSRHSSQLRPLALEQEALRRVHRPPTSTKRGRRRAGAAASGHRFSKQGCKALPHFVNSARGPPEAADHGQASPIPHLRCPGQGLLYRKVDLVLEAQLPHHACSCRIQGQAE
jgi:hypothetical protein